MPFISERTNTLWPFYAVDNTQGQAHDTLSTMVDSQRNHAGGRKPVSKDDILWFYLCNILKNKDVLKDKRAKGKKTKQQKAKRQNYRDWLITDQWLPGNAMGGESDCKMSARGNWLGDGIVITQISTCVKTQRTAHTPKSQFYGI